MNTWTINQNKVGNHETRRLTVVIALAMLLSFVPRPASVHAQGRVRQTLAAKPTPVVRESTCVGGRAIDTGDDLNGKAATRACLPSTAPEPDRLDLLGSPVSQKVRYVSFTAGNAGQSQAVRVTFQNEPAPYESWNGLQLWVQEPELYCECNGVAQSDPCPSATGGLPLQFWGATLGCAPWWDDWTQYDVVHLFDEGIIPSAVYDLQVVDAGCVLSEESSYSDLLRVTTSGWCDLVRDCTTVPCGPPNGTTNILDPAAVFDKWKNMPGNIQKARGDFEGAPSGDHRLVDQKTNITDFMDCLNAFAGEQYPPSEYPDPSPVPCGGPSSVCGNGATEPGEECDDGDLVPGDGCDENCRSEACGNGSIDGDEQCDDGPDNSDVLPDACRTNCTLPRCGDDVVDTGEDCDDGNTTPGDGCSESC